MEASTVFTVEKTRKSLKIKHWKAPQLFCTSGKTQNFLLVGGRVGWEKISLQDERFHTSPSS